MPSATSHTTAAPLATGVTAGATSAEPPRLVLPGSHFAAALVFWVVGAAGLVAVAPDLAAGLYPLPRVVAVTHLFTLGWITTSILGALYQFLPVALGTQIRWERTALVSGTVYVAGLGVFAAGMFRGAAGLRLSGAVLFGSALLAFVLNLLFTLRRARVRDLTWWSLAGASLFLASTVILGVALAVNLATGVLGGSRGLATAVHVHLALFGWVLLVMIGVGRHLLPMFLLSHGAPAAPGRWAIAGVGLGSAGLLVLHHAPPLFSQWLPGLALAIGAAAFLLQSAAYYRHRRKPRLDAGMQLAAAGLVLLAGALLQAPLALSAGAGGSAAWTGYVGTLVLGISLFVAGHHYKIVPFLVWYHRFGPLAGSRPLPRVADLFDARAAQLAVVLLAVGSGVLVGAIASGAPAVARVGATCYLAGALVEAVQMLSISMRRPA